MGISTLFKSLPNFGPFGVAIGRRSTTSNPTLIFASNSKFIHTTNRPEDGSEAKDAINSGANEGMIPGENMMSYSTTDQVSQKTKEMAEMLNAKAHEVSAMAKQAMEAEWDSTKETVKESKEFVKANAESVEKSMNTKNRS